MILCNCLHDMLRNPPNQYHQMFVCEILSETLPNHSLDSGQALGQGVLELYHQLFLHRRICKSFLLIWVCKSWTLLQQLKSGCTARTSWENSPNPCCNRGSPAACGLHGDNGLEELVMDLSPSLFSFSYSNDLVSSLFCFLLGVTA